ncbi:MAG: PBP1A family penicillin-binding protein [Candidatus Pacebacteria bacterium]|nr:PBP1A family penicillin-binding protein [Candidatus Paceibacterota bacterium]
MKTEKKARPAEKSTLRSKKKRKTRQFPKTKKKRLIKKGRFYIILLLLLSIFSFWLFILKDLPSPTKLENYDFPVSTQIFDSKKRLLYEIYAEKKRTPIKIENIPDHLKWATIASEDKDFYHHRGFAFRGIIRGFYNTIFKKSLQGGSTITQQLIKNALLTQERTIQRKIREAILAWLTEIIYSKDQILEMYFNQVPYGGTAWGIETAAQTYFNKSTPDLTLAESALLAGLPASPTRFSPFGAHPDLAINRQKRVLQRMVEDGHISLEDAQEAEKEALNFAPMEISIKAPHFVLWIKEKLVEQYGERLVEQGGLRITTTLDLDLQEKAQQIIHAEIDKLENLKVANGAGLITAPETGAILALIGSHDYFDLKNDGNVNVVLRPRQPGSAIKPLNYALAFENKTLTPASVINDIPTCFKVAGQKSYCPVNYDGQFHGPVQTRFALGNSYNIPAVKTLVLNGLEEFINFAKKMGITSFTEPKNYGLSLTLGGGEVTMYDLTTAFSAFANNGIRQNLYAIEKVENWQGKVLYQHQESPGARVISPETAYLISHILSDNNARTAAFGSHSQLLIKDHPEVAVKTGTTNEKKDNWAIGFTPDFSVSVWVGNNDNTPMSQIASGTTGASSIWNQIMSLVLKDKKSHWPPKPEGIVGIQICAVSGLKPASNDSCPVRFEYFDKDTLPEEIENLERGIAVDKTSGQLANSDTLPENIEIQNHRVVWDKLGTPYCLDCSFPTQAQILDSSRVLRNFPQPTP